MLTQAEIQHIVARLHSTSKRSKRKFDFPSIPGYNEGMSRTKLLAQAFDGEVIEDLGYRGIIYVKERNEYMRYHTTAGVHVVMRQPRVWRTTRHVLTPDEIRPFLEEVGLLPKITPVEAPLDQLARITGGQVVTTFQTGGGVFKTPQGVCYRFSNMTGLDIVEYIVSKWRSVRHLAHRNDILRALQDRSVHNLLTKEEIHYDRRSDHLRADGRGGAAGTGAPEEGEGIPQGVPGQEGREARIES